MSGARQPQRTRSELMRQGLALMAAKGIHGCRVEEITAAAGVAKGSFFVHFPSKEAFVAAVVESVLTDLARRIRPIGMHPLEPGEMLEAIGAVHLRFFQLRPEAGSILMQILASNPGSTHTAQALGELRAYLEMLAEMLGPASAALGWEPAHARELALAVVGMSAAMFALGQRLEVLSHPPAELLDALARALARGMARD